MVMVLPEQRLALRANVLALWQRSWYEQRLAVLQSTVMVCTERTAAGEINGLKSLVSTALVEAANRRSKRTRYRMCREAQQTAYPTA
jgi:hypothetical protein